MNLPTDTPTDNKVITKEQHANRVLWVKALLSGDYEQTGSQLHKIVAIVGKGKVSAYCCLGVAGCILEPNAHWLTPAANYCYLPNDWAKEKFGIDLEDENFETSDQEIATQWNDTHKYPFAQIADFIALATERNQPFAEVTAVPEVATREPGDYAREWLKRQESSD